MKRLIIITAILLITLSAWAARINLSGTGSRADNVGTGSVEGTVSGGGGEGTDWTSSEYLQALYLFESSPGINQDSSGNGNHIDDAGPTTGHDADTSNYIEGSQSGDNDNTNSEGAFLNVSSMSADFPSNSNDDGEITIAGWVRIENISSSDYIMSIGGIQVLGMDGSYFDVHANGTSGVNTTSSLEISSNTWYFIAYVYSDTANYAYIYVREYGSGASTWNSVAADIGPIDQESSGDGFALGCLSSSGGNSISGQLDAWAVFNGKAFSQEELDGVFSYGWDGNGW